MSPPRPRAPWWAASQEVDPISLEPIAELAYPPLLLAAAGEAPRTAFDGQLLAQYLVSTGRFQHPLTRRALTRDECRAIDDYLDAHGLRRARVADAFDLHAQAAQAAGSAPEGEQLRRAATAVFHTLFSFERYEERRRSARARPAATGPPPLPLPPPPPRTLAAPGAPGSVLVHSEPGLRVFDSDIAQHASATLETEFNSHFPSLPGAALARRRSSGPSHAVPPPAPPRAPLAPAPVGRPADAVGDVDENAALTSASDTATANADSGESTAAAITAGAPPAYVSTELRSRRASSKKKGKDLVFRAEALDGRNRGGSAYSTGSSSSSSSSSSSWESSWAAPKRARAEWLERELARRTLRRRVVRALLALYGLIVAALLWRHEWSRPSASVASAAAEAFAVFLAVAAVAVLAAVRIDAWAEPLHARHELGGPSFGESDVAQRETRFGVTLLCLGTRGDVEPLLAVAQQLERHGCSVLLCAPGEFQSLAQSFGVPFRSCGVDRLAPTASWGSARSMREFWRAATSQFEAQFEPIARGFWEACQQQPGPSGHCTDCVLAGAFAITPFATDIAEALCVPVWGFKFAPDAPSAQCPPFGEERWGGWWGGPRMTRLRHVPKQLSALGAISATGVFGRANAFREQHLGLPELTGANLSALASLPLLYGYSVRLAPRPADWPVTHLVTGFCTSEAKAPDAASEEAVACARRFCQARDGDRDDAKPVCVTFGSMYSALGDADSVAVCACVRAVRQAGRRCVLVCPDQDLASRPELALLLQDRAHVLWLRAAPYGALFPLLSAVVHHGGAGTTARAVLHGLPSVVIPVLSWYDQKGWALALRDAGVGLLVPREACSEAAVAASLRRLLDDPSFHRAASKLARQIRAEDGARAAAQALLNAVRPSARHPKAAA